MDRYLFESANALGEFDDWFRDVRTRLNLVRAPQQRGSPAIDLDADLIAGLRRKVGKVIGDMFRPGRIASGPRVALEAFHTVFLDFGLVREDGTLALKPLAKHGDFRDDWLLAGLAPPEVLSLRDRAAAINRRALAAGFDLALSLKPSGLIDRSKTAVAWLDALSEGLADTASRGEGVLLGEA